MENILMVHHVKIWQYKIVEQIQHKVIRLVHNVKNIIINIIIVQPQQMYVVLQKIIFIIINVNKCWI